MTDNFMLLIWLFAGIATGVYLRQRGVVIPLRLSIPIVIVLLLLVVLIFGVADASTPYPEPYPTPTPDGGIDQLETGTTGIALVDFSARSGEYNSPALFFTLGFVIAVVISYVNRKRR